MLLCNTLLSAYGRSRITKIKHAADAEMLNFSDGGYNFRKKINNGAINPC